MTPSYYPFPRIGLLLCQVRVHSTFGQSWFDLYFPNGLEVLYPLFVMLSSGSANVTNVYRIVFMIWVQNIVSLFIICMIKDKKSSSKYHVAFET